MAKYADLDYERKESLLAWQYIALLAIQGLSKATKYSMEHWKSELNLFVNQYLDTLSETEFEESIKKLDRMHEQSLTQNTPDEPG